MITKDREKALESEVLLMCTVNIAVVWQGAKLLICSFYLSISDFHLQTFYPGLPPSLLSVSIFHLLSVCVLPLLCSLHLSSLPHSPLSLAQFALLAWTLEEECCQFTPHLSFFFSPSPSSEKSDLRSSVIQNTDTIWSATHSDYIQWV